LTLRELLWLATGKAEMLGMTKGSGQPAVIPYDPKLLGAM
jgi:hypothetical protein